MREGLILSPFMKVLRGCVIYVAVSARHDFPINEPGRHSRYGWKRGEKEGRKVDVRAG